MAKDCHECRELASDKTGSSSKLLFNHYLQTNHFHRTLHKYLTIKQYTKSCTYVGLYGSGLFHFVSYARLQTFFTCFLGFDIPTCILHFYWKCFFIILVSIVFFEWIFGRLQKYWCKLYNNTFNVNYYYIHYFIFAH